jgi:hypothetical protein
VLRLRNIHVGRESPANGHFEPRVEGEGDSAANHMVTRSDRGRR